MLALLLSCASASAGPAGPRVTLIGDSVMTSVLWYSGPTATLESDLDLHLEVAVCRRLTGMSCPFEGVTPPNLLRVVSQLGRTLGPTVVVVMGYNDHESRFAQSVEASLSALRAAGVTRVMWASLREVRHSYVRMNEMLAAVARAHPELTIADWNRYSRSHPEWFQNDGIHLEPTGGAALATFLHGAIVDALSRPLPVLAMPEGLPSAHVGRRYRVELKGLNGVAPYRFSIVGGILPRGLQLLANGTINGEALHVTRERIQVRIVDARQHSTVQTETIVVTG